MTTWRVRGPWTPSTRSSSMSLVAEGPLIQVVGREIAPPRFAALFDRVTDREAALLQHRVGETFPGVVVDVDHDDPTSAVHGHRFAEVGMRHADHGRLQHALRFDAADPPG